LEEFQLTTKTLENTLQTKTNEFNQKLNNVQHELNQVEQKNKVTNFISLLFLFELLYFFYLLKDLLTKIDQLNILNSTNDAKLIESNGIINELKNTNEVFASANINLYFLLMCIHC